MPIIKPKPSRTQGFLEQLIERMTRKCKLRGKKYSFLFTAVTYSNISSITVGSVTVDLSGTPVNSLSELNSTIQGMVCCQGYCICGEGVTHVDEGAAGGIDSFLEVCSMLPVDMTIGGPT